MFGLNQLYPNLSLDRLDEYISIDKTAMSSSSDSCQTWDMLIRIRHGTA